MTVEPCVLPALPWCGGDKAPHCAASKNDHLRETVTFLGVKFWHLVDPNNSYHGGGCGMAAQQWQQPAPRSWNKRREVCSVLNSRPQLLLTGIRCSSVLKSLKVEAAESNTENDCVVVVWGNLTRIPLPRQHPP